MMIIKETLECDFKGGNNNNGINSEYVRQELRAIVGARTQQQQQQQQPQQPSPRQQHIQQVSAADLEALGLTFEISSGEFQQSDFAVCILHLFYLLEI